MSNICFNCQRALGGCSWSKSFIPVEGWTATPTTTSGCNGGKVTRIETFDIRACPLFLQDPPRQINYAMISEEENERYNRREKK